MSAPEWISERRSASVPGTVQRQRSALEFLSAVPTGKNCWKNFPVYSRLPKASDRKGSAHRFRCCSERNRKGSAHCFHCRIEPARKGLVCCFHCRQARKGSLRRFRCRSEQVQTGPVYRFRRPECRPLPDRRKEPPRRSAPGLKFQLGTGCRKPLRTNLTSGAGWPAVLPLLLSCPARKAREHRRAGEFLKYPQRPLPAGYPALFPTGRALPAAPDKKEKAGGCSKNNVL